MRYFSSIPGYMAVSGFFITVNAAAGDITCTSIVITPSAVNGYMCEEIADFYAISLEKFFKLNPSLNFLCDAVKPKTEYCVAGFVEYLASTDGFCGPKHNNASCIGTEKQCCNAVTWKCGNSPEDCATDTCYEGLCVASPSVYSLDGKCGPSTGDKECSGKWGNCCNHDGLCGTGPDFCSLKNCHNGACEPPPRHEPAPTWTFGTTPDGSCGGNMGYTCGVIHGECCSKDNKCGGSVLECGAGCQSEFGKCDPPGTTRPQIVLPILVWDPKTQNHVTPPATKDGSCGGSQLSTCAGSGFGECCSKGGQCGSTASHCGQGCQFEFSSKCLPTNISSIDGTCGPANGGITCAGGPFDGNCCSVAGWCGTLTDHCDIGCQKGYGKCNQLSL